MDDAIHVGCNRAFLFDRVKLDFLFSIDIVGIEDYLEQFIHYKGDNCVKFIGDQVYPNKMIPESIFARTTNARKYKTSADIKILEEYIPVDIDIHPLWNSVSVVHQAMQFILYTNPRHIYLVGCDCSIDTGKYFVGQRSEALERQMNSALGQSLKPLLLDGWARLKRFAQVNYPETEIISINPIGLKGLYIDVDASLNRI
jgi:hypothetical protein